MSSGIPPTEEQIQGTALVIASKMVRGDLLNDWDVHKYQ